MKKLILVRHGESTWNVKGLVQGRQDPSLSQKGKKQARMLAERFKDVLIHAIYSSNQKRAVETAKITADAKNLSVKTLGGLGELSFGEWEGRRFLEIANGYSSMLELWIKKGCASSVRGAEPLLDFQSRAVSSLEEIVRGYDTGNVLVVTHGGVIGIFLCYLLNLDISQMWRFRFSNCSVSEIQFFKNNSSRVSLLNDTSHLAGLRKESALP